MINNYNFSIYIPCSCNVCNFNKYTIVKRLSINYNCIFYNLKILHFNDEEFHIVLKRLCLYCMKRI